MALPPSDPVRALMLDSALPDFATNPVGVAARHGLVSKLEASVPGNGPSERSLFPNGQGPSYQSVFFGSAPLSPLEPDVAAVTGIGEDRWSAHATALLCQSMYEQTTDVRAQLDHDKINADLARLHADVTAPTAAAAWYGHALALCQPVVKAALAQLANATAAAKQRYADALLDTDWVTERREAYKDGTWINADWELYHHWARLSLLGATPDEIATLIGSLQAEDLPVDVIVDGTNWRSYVVWLGQPLSHADIDADARAGIFRVREDVYTPPRGTVDLDEGFALAFVEDGQPGAVCKADVPSGSCLAAGAQVTMADDGLQPIERLRPGARIRTPRGPRTVAVVATPARGHRSLYAIGGSALRVTGMHPLASGDGRRDVLAVSPRLLSRWVPTFAGVGIGRLAPGARALAITDDGLVPVEIASVVEERGDSSTVAETLYDLICEPDGDGIPPYLAGDGQTQMVVFPELPRVTAAPHAARAVLAMLDEVEPTLRVRLAGTADHELPAALEAMLRPLRGGLTDAVARAHTSSDDHAAPEALTEHVRSRMATFNPEPDGIGYDRVRGAVLEVLAAHFAAPLDEAVRARRRELEDPLSYPPDVVAVTLFDVHAEEPLGEIHAVQVRLDGAAPIEEAELSPPAASSSLFTRALGRVVVFSAPVPDGVASVQVALQTGAGPLAGTAALARPGLRPHRRLEALLRTPAGEFGGRLTLDLRPLSGAALERERSTRAAADDDDPCEYAEALGRVFGALLAERLAPAGDPDC